MTRDTMLNDTRAALEAQGIAPDEIEAGLAAMTHVTDILDAVDEHIEPANTALARYGLALDIDAPADSAAHDAAREVAALLAGYITRVMSEDDPAVDMLAHTLLALGETRALLGGAVGGAVGIGYALALRDQAGDARVK